MRLRTVVLILIAAGLAGPAWPGGQAKTPTPAPKAKAAIRPGVIALIEAPAGLAEPQGPPAGQPPGGTTGPLEASPLPAGKSSGTVRPLSLRDGLAALNELPGGSAALDEVSMKLKKTTMGLIAAAPATVSLPPSPKVPTDWTTGVVLSLLRPATAFTSQGSAYLLIRSRFVRGDIIPPAYWPGNDVMVLSNLEGMSPIEIPGRGRRSCDYPLCARWTLGGHASAYASEAYLIEIGLRELGTAMTDSSPMTLHVFVNGVYLPVARVGETDRYLGIVSLRPGGGGIDLYLENMANKVAFFYLKVQRIPG